MLQPFTPIFGSTVSLSATDSSGSVAFGSALGTHALIVNNGANIAYVELGGTSVTATTADLPVLAQSAIIVCIPSGATYMAAICDASATTTLKVMQGYGQ